MDATNEYAMSDLLTLIVSERADGLSVTPGQAPTVHLRGEAHSIEGPAVTPENAEAMLRNLAGTRQMRVLYERGTVAFLFTFRDTARFRVEATSEHEQIQFHIHSIEA